MYFDKKIFRQHYGKMYFRLMYYGFACALLFLQLTYYPTYFGVDVSYHYLTFTTGMIVAMCLCVAIGGYMYLDLFRQSKKKFLWFDAGKIRYQEDKKELISGKNHTYTYFIKKVDSVIMDERYFIVGGVIQKQEDDNCEMMTELYIPRCFGEEERFIKHVKTKLKTSKEGRVKRWWKK